MVEKKISQHILSEPSKQLVKSGHGPNTMPHKTHHTVEPTTNTSVSFASPVKERVRKAFTGVKQSPELPRTTVESRKDILFMEQSHENTN